MGSTTAQLAWAGVLVRVGYRPSGRITRNGTPVGVWRLAVSDTEAAAHLTRLRAELADLDAAGDPPAVVATAEYTLFPEAPAGEEG